MTTASLASSPVVTRRGPHFALWGAQVLLAVAFVGAGLMKATTPIEQLAAQMSWVAQVPPALVRFIGVAELLGAAGLVLPAATRILPVLTPIAAAALALVMVLAGGTHVALGEAPMVIANVVIGAVAVFIAWGRFRHTPIAPR